MDGARLRRSSPKAVGGFATMGFSGNVGRSDDRNTEEVTLVLERKIALLIELLRGNDVDRDVFCRQYSCAPRSFSRDLAHLRQLGDQFGFEISNQSQGRVRMTKVEPRLGKLAKDSDALESVLMLAASAFGSAFTGGKKPERSLNDGPLRIAMPQLEKDSHVAKVCAELEQACEKHARVRFHYTAGGNARPVERTVEPAFVLVRSGRYYLIAYDLGAAKAWRMYALDRISANVQRCGTFTPRPVPDEYNHNDVIGFIVNPRERPTSVTVWISRNFAESAASRIWQHNQVTQRQPDGSVEITFVVTDVLEVVRWALGFGTEAKVVSPEAAVAAAARLTKEIAALYEPDREVPSPARVVRRAGNATNGKGRGVIARSTATATGLGRKSKT